MSQNLIVKNFVIDCEFTDFIAMHLISLAIVGEDVAFYAEITDYPRHLSSSFVRENVEPLMAHTSDVIKNHTQLLQGNAPYLNIKFVRGTFAECSLALYAWLEDQNADLINLYANYSGDTALAADLLAESEVPGTCSFALKGIVDAGLFNAKVEDHHLNYYLNNKTLQHHALVDAIVAFVAFNTAQLPIQHD